MELCCIFIAHISKSIRNWYLSLPVSKSLLVAGVVLRVLVFVFSITVANLFGDIGKGLGAAPVKMIVIYLYIISSI